MAASEADGFEIPFESLTLGKELGAGFFGVVYKGTYLGTTVALKQLSAALSDEVVESFRNEVAVLKALRHPHVISFMGVADDGEKLYIVTEFAPGGDVLGLLEDGDVELSWKLRVRMARETVLALIYLHSKDVLHRDIKTGNLLLDDGYHVKVADFGIAKQVPSSKKNKRLSIVGSHFWMAPEVLFGKEYSTSADVFGFGMMLTELITRILPDPDELERTNDFGLVEASLRALATPKLPDALVAIVMACCNVKPAERPSWPVVLADLDALDETLPPAALIPVNLTGPAATTRCAECLLEISGAVIHLTAPVVRKYHSACFACAACGTNLGTSSDFRIHEGAVYCGADYRAKFGRMCAECGAELATSAAVSAVDEQLFCSSCTDAAAAAASDANTPEARRRRAETVSALVCTACAAPIAPGAKFLVAGGGHYHRDCFLCSVCAAPLASSFRSVDATLFCEEHYLAAHGTSCSRCGDVIPGRIMRVLDAALHPDCLKCYACNADLEGAAIHAQGDALYCSEACIPTA